MTTDYRGSYRQNKIVTAHQDCYILKVRQTENTFLGFKEGSINAVTTDNRERRHPYHSDKSDQLKSIGDQIKILVDNMQMLQSQFNSIESKAKEKVETCSCYNCYRQGHIAKDCMKPRRQFQRTQNRTDNSSRPVQTRRQPLNDNGSDQQA